MGGEVHTSGAFLDIEKQAFSHNSGFVFIFFLNLELIFLRLILEKKKNATTRSSYLGMFSIQFVIMVILDTGLPVARNVKVM